MSKIEFSDLEAIEIDGINTWDYPDFADAFILYAEIDGKALTVKQLEEVQAEYASEVHELALELAHQFKGKTMEIIIAMSTIGTIWIGLFVELTDQNHDE